MAPAAVEWLSEASPKLVTTIESAGHGLVSPSLAARGSANARPTARGRCDAMVEVCGMMARSACPKTLCRPPAMGSFADAARPSSTS
jgi:hypothetical protein